MNRIHRGNDVTQTFNFSSFTVSSVANIYFLLYGPTGSLIKRMAINEELPDFSSDDVTIVSDTEVVVRVDRAETDDLMFGRYTFQVKIAYNNPSFEDSVEIRSDAYPSFRVVADYERTREGDGIDLNFIVGGDVALSTTDDLNEGTVNLYWEEAPINNVAYVRQNQQWVAISLSELENILTVLAGGTTGQILSKISDTNYDFQWITSINEVIDFLDGGSASSSFSDIIDGGSASSSFSDIIDGGSASDF